jgi:hypothetical protein
MERWVKNIQKISQSFEQKEERMERRVGLPKLQKWRHEFENNVSGIKLMKFDILGKQPHQPSA